MGIRQEKVDQLQRRILDAQREVEEKVHAYTVCRESLLHVEQRVTALVGSYEQDHSTIEQVVIGCHINVAVADLVEMVVHGSLPVRNEKIFSKPWKMCSEDVLQEVDSVRNSCNDLLDNLERALAEVGRLVLTLS